MNWVEFGNKIKTARLNKGFTQKDIANIVKVTPESISYYESGKKRPSFDKIMTICKALDLNVNKL